MKKFMHIIAMIIFAFFLCRGPVMTDSFIIGSAFITYMVSRTHKNLYLLIPAIGSMISCIPKGFDPWGYIAATIICAIVFSLAGVNKLKLWQTSLIAASIVIICVSVYSLTFGSVYKTGPLELILDGVLTATIIFVFKNIFSNCKSPEAYVFVLLALIHGADLDFIIWMVIIFITLWTLNTCNGKTALNVIVAASIAAALMGEAQWGIMATLVIASFLAGYAKGRGTAVTTLIFAMVCWGLGYSESGVVLGVDTYGLTISALTFAVIYWRFGQKRLLKIDVAVSQKSAMGNMTGKDSNKEENGDSCSWQEIGKDKVALVISDGMGKGRKAASESRLVTKTILDLLKYNVPVEEAMRLMNSIMVIKNDADLYATLDLAVIDKKTGKAVFYKIGAAPSLIKKQDRIEEIQLAAVPLGIVDGLKICHVETTVRKGDKIIMMSDGVSDMGIKTIKDAAKSPKTCEVIMEKAEGYYRWREKDDMTVMVARIL